MSTWRRHTKTGITGILTSETLVFPTSQPVPTHSPSLEPHMEVQYLPADVRSHMDPCRFNTGVVQCEYDANRQDQLAISFIKQRRPSWHQFFRDKSRKFLPSYNTWITTYLKNLVACPTWPHTSSRCLYRCIFPWPFLSLSQSVWTHIANSHDSVSGYTGPLHACMNWASRPFGAHMHTPPAERHSCEFTPCPASPGTSAPSPLWLMDNSSVLDDTAKNRPLSCVDDVCTKDVSQVIKQNSQHGFTGHSHLSLSLSLWALSAWPCGPYPSQMLPVPQCKAQALCTGFNFHPCVSMWPLLLLETDPTEVQWAEMAVWVRKLQPGRTFPLWLLGLLYTLGVKYSALHANVPVSSVLGWELPSYLGLSQLVWIEEEPGNQHLRKSQ